MRRNNRVHRTLVVEELERRIAPAGAVTAGLVGKDLVITGDADANEIDITETAPGSLNWAITGTGTTVNGLAADTINGVTGKVIIKLGDGDDNFYLHDGSILGDLVMDFGLGTKTVDGHVLQVGGKLKVTGNGGSRHISLVDIAVTGKTDFKFRAGHNSVIISTTGGPPNVFDQDISYRSSLGTDGFRLYDTNVTRSVKLDLGDGPNTVLLQRSNIDMDFSVKGRDGVDDVTIREDTVIGGKATLNLGNGDNNIDVRGGAASTCTITDDLTVMTGTGNDVVEIDTNVTLGDNVGLKLGAGDNQISLTKATVDGDFRVQAGDGEDNVSIFDSTVGEDVRLQLMGGGSWVGFFRSTTTKGDFRVDGKGGNDVINLEDGTVGRDVRLFLGDGTNYVDILVAGQPNNPIGRNVEIKTGGGDDTVDIGDCAIGGKMKLDVGDGANTVTVDPTSVGGMMQIKGKNGVDNLTLTDVNVTGKVQIDLGDENNILTTNVKVQVSNAFGDQLQIKAKNGDDTFNISNLDVVGKAQIDAGGGDNTLTLGDSTFDADLSVKSGNENDTLDIVNTNVGLATGAKASISAGNGANAVTVSSCSFGGATDVKTGNGFDLIDIDQLTVGGRALVSAGSAEDRIDIDDSDFNDQAKIDPGAHCDEVYIETAGTAGPVSNFVGACTVMAKSGNDVITVGVSGAADRSAVFNALADFIGSTGFDTLDAGINAGHLNGNTFGGGWNYSGFEVVT